LNIEHPRRHGQYEKTPSTMLAESHPPATSERPVAVRLMKLINF